MQNPSYRTHQTGKVDGEYSDGWTIAVIVLSHNYGRFLPECLESVLSQSRPAAEVVIVDDSSTDSTPQISESFAERGVQYIRVDFRNVHQARKAGFDQTEATVVCFLDADDVLPSDYLDNGLAKFKSYDIGIVYSDVQTIGRKRKRRTYPPRYDRGRLECDNHIHSGSLVLREAIELNGVFDRWIDPLKTQGDWFLWRSILRDGWQAVKQDSIYQYRQHDSNWTLAMRREPQSYFAYAGLDAETVTLFTPLSGRAALLPGLFSYLQQQTWPHDQIRLVLMDTSQDVDFSKAVKEWVSTCDYSDVRHIQESVATPGLADEDRRIRSVQEKVRVAVARIYNRMAREVTTDYVWVLEDDVIPPDDVCERLLQRFDVDTASVAAPYDSRFDGKPCVWDQYLQHVPRRETGAQIVFGNGFGCVMLRGGVVRYTVFTATGDFDRMFYRRLAETGLKAKVDWSCAAAHVDSASDHGDPSGFHREGAGLTG